MFITYRRAGRSAVLPGLAAAGILIIVAGIAATIGVIALVVVGALACGGMLRRAFGMGVTKRPLVRPVGDIIEGVVVDRPSSAEPRSSTLLDRVG